MRRLVAVTLALAAGLALASPALGAPPRTPSATQVTIFRAFTAAGHPTLPAHARRGSCLAGSAVSPRRDAWRCTAGDAILDPCFDSPRARGRVMCPGVEMRHAVLVVLRTPLPRGSANRGRPSLRDQPFDLELPDGRHYGLTSGASEVIDGRRLNYLCGRSCRIGLWGLPRRSEQPWTILAAPYNAPVLRDRRAIARAWM